MGALILPERVHLKKFLTYCPFTGQLTWKVARPGLKAGSPAGHWRKDKKGTRRVVRLETVLYLSSRLIWRMQTGEDPGELLVDHKNRITTDESWGNLRLATHPQNCGNSRGYGQLKKGVYRVGNRYHAKIHVNYKQVHLGTFATEEEASKAYIHAAEKHFGDYALPELDT